jgi:hypothetical protein
LLVLEPYTIAGEFDLQRADGWWRWAESRAVSILQFRKEIESKMVYILGDSALHTNDDEAYHKPTIQLTQQLCYR